MIEFTDELHRLTTDSGQEGPLPTGGLVADIDVRCSGNAATVLERVRGLLGLVVRHRLMNPPDEEAELDPFEVDVAHWAAALPPWFLNRTPFESADRPPGMWTVEGWLYWFLSAGEDRAWRWLSSSVSSSTRVVAVIQVADVPLPWDALRWAFLSAGAESADL